MQRWRHKVVRDLDWVVRSGTPVSEAAGLPLLEDAWCRERCPQEWLAELDRDPTPVLRFLSAVRDRASTIGFYGAALLEFWLRYCPSTAAGEDAVGPLQLHHDGVTAGAVKLVVKIPGGLEADWLHVESSFKFFMDATSWPGGEGSPAAIVGPYLHENLLHRAADFNRKLTAAATPAAAAALRAAGVGEICSRAFLRGWLFRPAREHFASPAPGTVPSPWVSPRALWGWFTERFDEEVPVDPHNPGGSALWASVPKAEWMSPCVAEGDPPALTPQRCPLSRRPRRRQQPAGLLQSRAELSRALAQHFAQADNPVMVAAFSQQQPSLWYEVSRGFVVPRGWDPTPLIGDGTEARRLVAITPEAGERTGLAHPAMTELLAQPGEDESAAAGAAHGQWRAKWRKGQVDSLRQRQPAQGDRAAEPSAAGREQVAAARNGAELIDAIGDLLEAEVGVGWKHTKHDVKVATERLLQELGEAEREQWVCSALRSLPERKGDALHRGHIVVEAAWALAAGRDGLLTRAALAAAGAERGCGGGGGPAGELLAAVLDGLDVCPRLAVRCACAFGSPPPAPERARAFVLAQPDRRGLDTALDVLAYSGTALEQSEAERAAGVLLAGGDVNACEWLCQWQEERGPGASPGALSPLREFVAVQLELDGRWKLARRVRSAAQERPRGAPASAGAVPLLRLPEEVSVVWAAEGAALGEARGALLRLVAGEVFGCDCEWRPGGGFNPVALLQIATPGRVWLVDCIASAESCPGAFAELLQVVLKGTPSGALCAGFEWRNDVRRLAESYPHLMPPEGDSVWVELRMAAPTAGQGLSDACAEILGRQLCKREQCSDWGARPLSAAQLDYAALDAWVLTALAERCHLRERLRSGGGGVQRRERPCCGARVLRAAAAAGLPGSPTRSPPPGTVVAKTIALLAADEGRCGADGRCGAGAVLAVLRDEDELDLPALAAACASPPLRLAAAGELLSVFGMRRGGVGPVGPLCRAAVVVDAALGEEGPIAVGAGEPGWHLVVGPGELRRALGAAFADVRARREPSPLRA
eukprot:TRINITY_DN29428_c0_g1_i1.p1 TRINITY_DN29428_c0_g1~~TRINITY_DN29428_c0_g1_i1.p1  ORF type:complete len:1066 (+),score=325.30 TRINITY_DN29428_c0_g1_i1:66-3200(+)